jgi:hypothetical protein
VKEDDLWQRWSPADPASNATKCSTNLSHRTLALTPQTINESGQISQTSSRTRLSSVGLAEEEVAPSRTSQTVFFLQSVFTSGFWPLVPVVPTTLRFWRLAFGRKHRQNRIKFGFTFEFA